MIKISKEKDSEKLKVDVYIPTNVCACEWDKFINRVFIELTPFIKYIDHETKDLNSVEAKALNIRNKCIVINGENKISSPIMLRKELPKLIKAKGLI